MARLVPSLGDCRAAETRQVRIRYRFDERGLIAHFGGIERLRELSRIHGLPQPPGTFSTDVRQAYRLTTYLPVLLELAHRMHRQLDLHEFVQELR